MTARLASVCAAVALGACLAAPAAMAADPVCYRVTGVRADDFLYIRSRPDHRSMAVGAIAPSTSRQIRLAGQCTPKTTDRRKLWCLVDYHVNNDYVISGYVKMFYLERAGCTNPG